MAQPARRFAWNHARQDGPTDEQRLTMPETASIRWVVFVVAAALALTKLLDVLSTIRAVEAPRQESNPLAARFMRAVGVRPAVWLVFALSCAVIVASAWLALDGPLALTVAFCALGLAVASVQACVARANIRGRHDAVTQLVLRLHRHIAKDW